jgi:hypothetical protein
MPIYEIVLSFDDSERSFFSRRRPIVGEALRMGQESLYVSRIERSAYRFVDARYVCKRVVVDEDAVADRPLRNLA